MNFAKFGFDYRRRGFDDLLLTKVEFFPRKRPLAGRIAVRNFGTFKRQILGEFGRWIEQVLFALSLPRFRLTSAQGSKILFLRGFLKQDLFGPLGSVGRVYDGSTVTGAWFASGTRWAQKQRPRHLSGISRPQGRLALHLHKLSKILLFRRTRGISASRTLPGFRSFSRGFSRRFPRRLSRGFFALWTLALTG